MGGVVRDWVEGGGVQGVGWVLRWGWVGGVDGGRGRGKGLRMTVGTHIWHTLYTPNPLLHSFRVC